MPGRVCLQWIVSGYSFAECKPWSNTAGAVLPASNGQIPWVWCRVWATHSGAELTPQITKTSTAEQKQCQVQGLAAC